MWLLLTRFNSEGKEETRIPIGSDYAYHTTYVRQCYIDRFIESVRKATSKLNIAAGYTLSDYDFRRLDMCDFLKHAKCIFRNRQEENK
jgi:hypothetical protein